MSFRDLLEEDQRLVLLRALMEMPGHEANESILQSCLHAYGHNTSRDQVYSLLDWLAEQGFCSTRHLGHIKIVRLTSRGLDVAAGRVVASGVKRPRPWEED